MRITLTGEVAIEGAAGRVTGPALGGRQMRVALTLLVLERTRPVRKDELADLLWPDRLPPTWEVALRGVLGRVRRVLASAGWDPPDALTAHAGSYRLRLPPDVAVDVEELVSDVAAAESALALGNRVVALAHAASAAALAERSLQEGDDSVWLDARRAELQAHVVRSLTTLAQAALDSGDPVAAVEIATRLVQIEPFGEPGHRLLVEAHAAAGDRILATHAFERYRHVLASEIGAAPSDDLEETWRATVGHPAHHRSPGSSSSLPHEVVRLRAAGDEAMRRPEPALAAERYADAATAAARAGAVDAYADLLVDVGQARKLAGDPAGADRALTEAADLARRRHDPVLLGRAALALAGMELITPRVAPGPLQLIEEALERLPPLATPLRAALLTRRAQYLGDEARLADLESTSQAAADVARSCGSATTLVDALVARLPVVGAPLQAGERLALAGEIRERLPSRGGGATRLLALDYRVFGLVELGEWAAAIAAMDLYKQEAEESGLPQARWYARQHDVCRLVVSGALADCDAAIDESVEGARAVVDERVADASGVFYRIVPRWLQGRLGELGDAMHEIGTWLGHPPRNRAGLALLAASRGARREARQLLDGVLAELDDLPADSWWAPTVCYLSAACLRGGTAAEAAALRARLLPLTGRDGTFQGKVYYGSYRFFSGALACRSGEYDAACVDLEAALAHHETMGARPWIVLARRELVEALRARNRGADVAYARRLEQGLDAMAAELTMDVCCTSP
jgi:DNA-binding SARP family transcriptional activator